MNFDGDVQKTNDCLGHQCIGALAIATGNHDQLHLPTITSLTFAFDEFPTPIALPPPLLITSFYVR